MVDTLIMNVSSMYPSMCSGTTTAGGLFVHYVGMDTMLYTIYRCQIRLGDPPRSSSWINKRLVEEVYDEDMMLGLRARYSDGGDCIEIYVVWMGIKAVIGG